MPGWVVFDDGAEVEGKSGQASQNLAVQFGSRFVVVHESQSHFGKHPPLLSAEAKLESEQPLHGLALFPISPPHREEN